MKPTRVMPAVDGLTPGSIATLDFPLGLSYHELIGTLGGTTFDLSHITEFRLKGNGKEIFKDSGAHLNLHQQYDGMPAASNIFSIMFDRYGLNERNVVVGKGSDGNEVARRALRTAELTAIGTGIPSRGGSPELTTLQLEMDISSSAVAPTLSFKARVSAKKPLGILRKRRKFVYNPGGAVEFEISDLPRGDLIDKIYIHSANDAITQVKIQRDNFDAFDRTPAENTAIQTSGVRVPQSGIFVIDPSEYGLGDEALVTASTNDFRLKITVSQSDTLTLYVDYLGSIQGN